MCSILSSSSPVIENTIIAFNVVAGGGQGGDYLCELGASAPTLACCDVYGNVGGSWTGCIASQLGINGNFSAAPRFCDPNLGDFTLEARSPCLPGEHPAGVDCGLIGAYGFGCEAPTPAEQMTWGEVKALHR